MSESSEPEPTKAPELPPREESPGHLFARVRDKAHVSVPARVALTEPEPEILATRIFCVRCGRYAEQGGYAVLLCRDCRRALSFSPFPVRMRVALAALALVVGLALVRLPGSVAAGTAFERGVRAERRGDFRAAAAQYRRVVRHYPDETPLLVRLAVADAETGNVDETRRTLDRLSGRTLSNPVILELNRAESRLRRTMEAR